MKRCTVGLYGSLVIPKIKPASARDAGTLSPYGSQDTTRLKLTSISENAPYHLSYLTYTPPFLVILSYLCTL
ncbi:hypothetical protein DCM91_15880 [Chitinophaga costaii]|nr:hypothetical protein DCM91_15880 [Chitinophaga costaii]